MAVLVALLTIQVATLIILQFPRVQTFAAQTVTGAISEKANGDINVGKVYIVFFNRILVKDVSIVSNQRSPLLDSLKSNFGYSDTLLRCDKLSVSFDMQDLLGGELKIKKVSVSGGEFNLQTEENRRTNLDRIFGLVKKTEKDTAKSSINLLAESLKINGFRFTMRNHTRYTFKGDSTVNFADLDVRNISVDISDVHLRHDTLFAGINRIHGRDKSGLTLGTLSGKARICGTEAYVEDFYLADSFSQINSRYFYMKYDSPKDFSDFTKKVVLGLDMQDSYLNFRTIGKIAPSLFKSRMAFRLNGEVSGPVCDLRSSNLFVTSDRGESFVDINMRLSGLPDVSRTMAVVEVKNSSVRFNDLSRIIASINGTAPNKVIASLAPGADYSFRGNLMGLLDDFVVDGAISSPHGGVDVDFVFRNERGYGSRFKGAVAANGVDAGAILSKEILGKTTFSSQFDVVFKRGGGIDLLLDTLDVDAFQFNGYEYRGLVARGSYIDNCYDGSIVSTDPNLNFSYDGVFTFAKDITSASRYDFIADVKMANLAALNLDRRTQVSQLSFNTAARFTNADNEFVNGEIDVRNFNYRGVNGIYNIGDIAIKSLHSSNIYTATLNAPFAKVEYSGPAPVNLFVKKVLDMAMVSKLDNYFDRDTSVHYKNGLYNFNVYTYNTMDIFQIIDSGLYLENNSRLNISIDRDNVLKGVFKSGRFALGKNYLKDFTLDIASGDSIGTTAKLFSKNIRLAGIVMDSTNVRVGANSNILDASFRFTNDSTGNNGASFLAKATFLPEKNMVFDILEGSGLSIDGEHWKFNPSKVSLLDDDIIIEGFNLYNKGQSLAMEGNISKYDYDSLDFRMNNFDVGIINMFLSKSFNIQGLFSGSGMVSDLYRAPKVFFDITGNEVSVYGNEVGTLKMMSKWNDVDKELNLYLKSSIQDRRTFLATGYYKPSESYLNLSASLEDLSVTYFEPFLSDIISKSSGSMSGDLLLSGPLDKLALTGSNCSFTNFGFNLNFTQVPYVVDGPFELDEKGIYFRNLPFKDKYGAKGIINGRLKYDYFRNPALDARINFTNLQCLDTKETDNEYFYGSAFATGALKLQGPFNNISLDIDAVSNRGTSIHIPLSSSATASQTDLLTFVEPQSDKWIDPYDTLSINRSVALKEKSNLKVDIGVQVTPDAEVMIEIDKSVGDVIKARGNGVIDLNIDPSKDVFDIFGDYHVTNGSYHFVLAGLATRDFTLQPGGTINFNGDITNTTLDLDAQYTTKTSINALIADTSSVSTRRNVNCIIGMQGKMMNPNLTFTIDVPDLDPTTKIRVESALNSQDKIQKQFMAMLVTGSFIPDEQSGIAYNSSMLYSNASEMLSNQINNIFNQLGIPLDLGLNYQPGERGTDIFDVAVSTQLFNNRVTINGNIGNDPYAQSSKDVVGNIDVEIKMDNSGNMRLDLFSHAEDKYSTYNNNSNSQRSGVGIFYQKEFNSFRSLLRGKSKAQKAYEKQERMKRKELKRQEKNK